MQRYMLLFLCAIGILNTMEPFSLRQIGHLTEKALVVDDPVLFRKLLDEHGRELLESFYESVSDEYRAGLLQYTCILRKLKCFAILLEDKRYPIDGLATNGRTLLMEVAHEGRGDIICDLIHHYHVPLDTVDAQGRTALDWAENPYIASLFKATSLTQDTLWTIYAHDDEKFLRAALDLWGIDYLNALMVTDKPQAIDSVWLGAISCGALRCLKVLCYENRNSINLANKQGLTVLMLAAGGKSLQTVQLLVENGANTDLKDAVGCKAFDYATDNQIQAYLQLMGSLQADDAATFSALLAENEISLLDGLVASDQGNTLAHVAVQKNANACLALLCKTQPSAANAVDQEGRTPLMFAAKQGSIGLAKILVEAGADATLVDKEGKMAADHISVYYHELDVFRKYLADITSRQLAAKQKKKP